LLLSASEALGISSEYFPRVASCVGAGLSLNGEVCGVVTGGLMVIGLLTGRIHPSDSNDIAYYYGDLYLQRVKELNGSHLCRNISKTDFTTYEGQLDWETNGIQKNICIPLMKKAVGILNEIIAEILVIKTLHQSAQTGYPS